MSTFTWQPAPFIPFRDLAAIERCRAIRTEDLCTHWNPDFRIRIVPAAELGFLWLTDMFHRIKTAADAGRPCVLITPQPWPDGYRQLAHLINLFRVDCRQLHTFNMDEYANDEGTIAPETWEAGFLHSMKRHFYANLDPVLRPAAEQIRGLSNRNLADYGRRLDDLGGADCCYSGPGWTGHLAFIEPDAPEFDAPLEVWKTFGPRVVTLSPFTIAQNSLHGAFGMSGDLCAVPPKAATIGPAQVIGAKHRFDMHGITVDGSFASWQRLTSRLVLHGPVTPRLPQSILQTLRTDVYVSEAIAANVEPHWEKGY
jgi:6-phosphogluconolactonase/glucosamine-6-phosphate isomerase/deaminase